MSATTTLTNGEKVNSQFINHLISYPLVSDTLSTYQKNSLGAKSIDVFHSLYSTFATPVLPYLQTPYSIIHPYLAKADSLGDSGLAKVDERFPAVKSTSFESLQNTLFGIVHTPLKLAGDGKNYVFRTYGDEYNKTKGATGSDGIVTTGKAVISTELRIALETVQAAWKYVEPKKNEAEKRFQEAKKAGWKKVDALTGKASEAAEQAKVNGEAKAGEVKKQAEELHHDIHHEAHKHTHPHGHQHAHHADHKHGHLSK